MYTLVVLWASKQIFFDVFEHVQNISFLTQCLMQVVYYVVGFNTTTVVSSIHKLQFFPIHYQQAKHYTNIKLLFLHKEPDFLQKQK